MPTYSFDCASPAHPVGRDRHFVVTINHSEGKRIDQYPCVVCGKTAKRDLVGDLASVNMVGATPISNSTTGKGSYAHTTEFAFGRHRKNPDGSVSKGERPFRDSGELDKYMNGQNDLGPPVLDDRGQPMRRKDGSVVRKGAKLFKYGANATPSHPRNPKREMNFPDTSIGAGEANEAVGRSSFFNGTPVVRTPQRRAR